MFSIEDNNIKIVNIIKNVWAARPTIHCITNVVTVNDCANMVLAMGAAPTMASDERETAEITSGCDALVLNMGNLAAVEGMINAGIRSNELKHPVILDPVGVGASQLRRDTFANLTEHIHLSVIRGNATEIRRLSTGEGTGSGVDASDKDAINESNIEKFAVMAKFLAVKYNCVVSISGKIDIIADSKDVYIVRNGTDTMSRVTGTGCMLTAMIGAVCGANKENVLACVLASVVLMNTAGERAYSEMNKADGGTMTFRMKLIDILSRLNEEELITSLLEKADYEKL